MSTYTTVLDYGADATGTNDSTTQIQNCINNQGTIIIPDGNYRIDGKITVHSGKAVKAYGGARLFRPAGSTNTDALVLLRDNYSQWDGGKIETLVNHPNGIVQLGHENATSSNWNSLYWKFQNVNLIGKQAAGNVGIYIPNSQVTLGSAYANYFGAVENVSILNSDVGIFLPEISNAHHFSNVSFWNMMSAAYKLRGVYACSVFGGFLHTSLNGVIGVWLMNRTVGTDHHSESNSFYGFGIEPGGASSRALVIESACARNDINISDNTSGGSTIGNLNNNINTKAQLVFRGGQYNDVSVLDSLVVRPGAVQRQQNRLTKSYNGTVAEAATATAANVTLNSGRYSAIVQVTVTGRSAAGLPNGGGLGTFAITRVDGGVSVTELSRNNSGSGVILQPCITSGNTVSVRVSGFNNGTGTSYNYTAEVSVVVENFDAITLS
ncbi:hypothetical protein SAMN05880556_101668 [Azospirillum sp. RU38E]|nr:hypothetical protein SAMN05880556_101668 [Azospirillum sp. RU38E]SNS10024.1 hypothetical protein SAMN05880591_101668 [Azospirillum sp. RU37A]